MTLELTSFEAATSAFCALSALVWMLSVVFAVTVLSERSMSVEIALIWLAASADVAVQRTLRLARAAQDRGRGVRADRCQCPFDVARQRLDVIGGIGGGGYQCVLGLAGPGDDGFGAGRPGDR